MRDEGQGQVCSVTELGLYCTHWADPDLSSVYAETLVCWSCFVDQMLASPLFKKTLQKA